MSNPTPARYRTTNWSGYTAPLRKRGSLLIGLDQEMTWLAPHDGSPGRPAVFSDAAIPFGIAKLIAPDCEPWKRQYYAAISAVWSAQRLKASERAWRYEADESS